MSRIFVFFFGLLISVLAQQQTTTASRSGSFGGQTTAAFNLFSTTGRSNGPPDASTTGSRSSEGPFGQTTAAFNVFPTTGRSNGPPDASTTGSRSSEGPFGGQTTAAFNPLGQLTTGGRLSGIFSTTASRDGGHSSGSSGGDDGNHNPFGDDTNPVLPSNYTFGHNSDSNSGRGRDYGQPAVFPNITTPRSVEISGHTSVNGSNSGSGNSDSGRPSNSTCSFNLNTQGDLSLGVDYFFNTSSSFSNPSFAFLLRALRVFEFVDRDGVAGYQRNTSDVIVGQYDLSALSLSQWKNLDIEQANITGIDNKTYPIYRVVAQTADEVLTLRFVLSGTPVKIGGVQLSSDSMKIDIIIRWFTPNHLPANWTSGPSNAATYPNSSVGISLALGAKVNKTLKLDHNPSLNSSNPSINFNGTDGNGFYSWEQNATRNNGTAQSNVFVDHQDVPEDAIKHRFEDGAVVQVMHFSFSGFRPSEVTWDPEYGRSAALSGSDANNTTTPTSGNNTTVPGITTSQTQGVNSSAAIKPLIAMLGLLLLLL